VFLSPLTPATLGHWDWGWDWDWDWATPVFISHPHVGVVCCLLIVDCFFLSKGHRCIIGPIGCAYVSCRVTPVACVCVHRARRIHPDISTCPFRHLFTLCYVHTTVSVSVSVASFVPRLGCCCPPFTMITPLLLLLLLLSSLLLIHLCS